ncbi:MAG: polyprenyl synthetase family protein [Deltaproteobacteria bacterium]|nr:polyprenyl synthetase family protein [Deltaproteobacteria bacterium]
MEIDAILAQKKAIFEDFLSKYLKENNNGSGIFDACAYSLTAGGKRIRPILTMLGCEMVGSKGENSLHAGLAIEMLHTFSLIHDDLPAIDNDDLRRGLPTCHKRFGDASAILAGDGLIFLAISVISSSPYPLDVKNDIIEEIARTCGINGLILGEYQDIITEGKEISLEDVKGMHRLKTSRLFELCMYAGAKIGGGNKSQIDALVSYGTHLGLAFQAIDDILDITSNEVNLGKASKKDDTKGKATVVKVLGLNGALQWAKSATSRAISALSEIPGDKETTHILKDLALSMLERVR